MSAEMQIVAAASAARGFELPDGWVLEVRPRGPSASYHASDKYYYEPHTGRQFRSLISVQRYLCGEEEPMPRSRRPKTHHEGALIFGTVRRIVYNGKLWNPEEFEAARRRKDATPSTAQHSVCSILPNGWIVEEVPRRCGLRSDRYFIDPETRTKFRSVPEVQRYLTAADRFPAKFRPLAIINSTTPPKSPCPRKKMHSLLPEMVNPENFNIFNPPEKITWLLRGSEEQNWIPFVDESQVPDHVKELWQDTFFLGMTGRKQRIPQLTMGKPDDA